MLKEIRECMESSQEIAKRARNWEILARRFAKAVPDPELPADMLKPEEESS